MAVLKDKIIIKNLSKTFYMKDKTVDVLKDINIKVKENEFLVILGPGQCGKTVLLNILSGLDKPTGGEITFTDGRPKMGDLGIVFQKYALFPWKTVMGNVEINQKLKGVDKKTRQKAASEYINLVGLKGFENSLPKQLSGGMKQRVGIARAYATESDIMIMDEPFGALDAQTRYSMEDEILKIWEKKKRTVIFVTNNVEEAIYLGDRIILLGGHPSGVKAEYIPDMSRPRNYTDDAFLKLRNEIVNNTDLSL
jgi:NitT/TauT family transport system ATP-binding protein/sulfonate transport system ATP-binding protein